jgi:RNA 2',3'-cyclic 3'-phosphodiesterase
MRGTLRQRPGEVGEVCGVGAVGARLFTVGMARLFIAVWPPEDVVADLMALRRKDQRGVRFLPPENWHVTLRFLGEAHADDVAEALDRTRLEACTAALGPGVDVLAERSLVLPVAGVDALAAAVAETTAAIGEPPRKRFVGHLTLAKIRPRSPMPDLLGALVQASFEVDEIALVASTLRPEGARYETIGTWPATAGTERDGGQSSSDVMR